jgi:type I restriction enzyme, S subunit
MEVKRGYKRTHVGLIPEDWEAETIGGVCSFSGGSQPPRATFKFTPTPGYIRLIQIRDYKSDDFATYIPESLARKRCTSEDIMIGRYGPPIFQILRGIEGAYNVALIKTALSARVDREFFFNVLNQEPLFQLIDALSRRSSGQTGVEMAALKSYALPLPPLPEQRAIAEALSDVDALLGGLDRLIAKKRDLKQAAMQQLLTGQTRLPGFHGEWEMMAVAELERRRLVRLFRGKIISKRDIESTPGDFPIYSSSVHNDGLFGCYGQFMFDEELITWSVDGGGNFFYRPKHKFSVTNVCGFMRVDTSRINYRYLAAHLQLLHSRKSFDYQSKAHPSVVRQEYEVQLPTLPEQTAIAEVLADMDAELTALEQRREKTRALKQAKMQDLLTGKTRLVKPEAAHA